ncbi:MAG: hypothetical protein ABIJ23_04070 [Candidatus Magasanikbacteria bacterium]
MKNFLIPIGVVWIGLSLIIGLVLVLGSSRNVLVTQFVPQQQAAKNIGTPARPNNTTAEETIAIVDIEGTTGIVRDNVANIVAEVEVK